jgi:acetylglutamate kinase
VLLDLEDESSIIQTLDELNYLKLKSEGVLHTGMLPKLENCFTALKSGVKQVRIGNPKMITETVNFTQIIN